MNSSIMLFHLIFSSKKDKENETISQSLSSVKGFSINLSKTFE